MLLSRIVVLLTFVALLSSQVPSSLSAQTSIDQSPEETAQRDTLPANCRVTLPSDGVFEPPSPVFGWSSSRTPDQFLFGTAALWTVLPTDGTLRGSGPEKPGDFAYHGKFAWYRTHAPFLDQDGPVSLKGKRLDGPAPTFIDTHEGTSYPGKDGSPAVIGMGMDVPIFGCWEFTGHYKDQDVTFTLWVTSHTEQEKAAHAYARSLSLPPPKRVIRRVQVDPDVQARELVYRVLPEIPAAAQATYGTVVLHAVIGTDGKTHELSYVSGPKPLAQAAIEAVRWWQYRINVVSLEPYEAQEVDTTISVLFSPP
jgi:Gram-negative bacterial TonB protein C-terminal